MFEKFKNLFKKKHKINSQTLVGQNLEDAHIGLLSGANSQNVDNVEINPSILEGKSLEGVGPFSERKEDFVGINPSVLVGQSLEGIGPFSDRKRDFDGVKLYGVDHEESQYIVPIDTEANYNELDGEHEKGRSR